MTRCIVIVLDSVKNYTLPNASDLPETMGTDAIGARAERAWGFTLPNFERLATGHLTTIGDVSAVARPLHGRRARNVAHGEPALPCRRGLSGIHTDVPFATFSRGFPPKVAGTAAGAGRVGTAVSVAAS